MRMEKYGVSDAAALQENELKSVKGRLFYLSSNHEKTAEDRCEISRLQTRKLQLEESIRTKQ